MNDRVVLVTGGANGLGRDIALVLGGKGWRVALADMDEAGGRAVAKEIESAGGTARFYPVDLATPEGAREMVAWAVEQFGRLDVLINNAALMVVEEFGQMTAEAWERMLAVNVRAVALAMSAAGEVMKRQGSGRIVNITSPASRFGHRLQACYMATKAAVDSLTRSGSVALAPHGIPVNSVAPGMMDTDMHRALERDMMAADGIEDFQAFHDERTARIPLGRRAEVREVTEAVVWLATEAPAYITAERLNVSGGFDKD